MMDFTLEWRFTRTVLLAGLLLAAAMLPISTLHAASSSATASIFVTILPVEGSREQQPIHVVPSQLELQRHEYGKISVSNHSGQGNEVTVQVSPASSNGCRLDYSPKRVMLNDGQLQVFRVFYVTENNAACHASFRLNIQSGQESKSIEVQCK